MKIQATGRELVTMEYANSVGRRGVIAGLVGTAAAAWWHRPAAAADKILRVAARANPSSLDPMTGGAGSDHVFLYPMFDTLIGFEPATLEARPALAESWTVPDNTTLVLNLRPGILFHDDTPCDAKAVKYNLDRSRLSPRSNIRADLAAVESVEVTGDLQVTLRLKEPDAALPLTLSDRAGMMFSPEAAEAAGDRSNRQPVGAGPWKFVSWADNERITVTRHPRYWAPGKPMLDGIEMSIITDISTALRSVSSGSNDFVYDLPPQQKVIVERSGRLASASMPSVYCMLLWFNYGRAPLDDQRVRQAINLAINRRDFRRATSLDQWDAATSLLPASHWAHDPDPAANMDHDLDRARALLAEAGHGGGMELNMLGYADQLWVQRQEVLMEQLSKVGIRLRFTVGSIADGSARYFAQRNGDGLLAAWTGRPDPSLSYSLMFGKDAYFNPSRLEGAPGLEEALRATRSTSDQQARKAAFSVVQRMVKDQALFAPLIFQAPLAAYNKRVKGFVPNLLGKSRFDNVQLDA
jgi:peptide/nickel transport system permease protein/peptide/nickel transport system substrate-binding protein